MSDERDYAGLLKTEVDKWEYAARANRNDAGRRMSLPVAMVVEAATALETLAAENARLREAAINALVKRRAIYKTKLGQAEPFGENDHNHFDGIQYVIEALDILEQEILRAIAQPATPTPKGTSHE